MRKYSGPLYLENCLHKISRKLGNINDLKVCIGQEVFPESVLAKIVREGAVFEINAAAELSCEPSEVAGFLLKKQGEKVSKGEILALTPGIFGLLRKKITSPADGVVESFSDESGQLLINELPCVERVYASVFGKVYSIDQFSIIIEVRCDLVQGIAGFGCEASGNIHVSENLNAECQSKIVVLEASPSLEMLIRAGETKIAGLITGGMEPEIIERFLGKEISVPITGNEKIPYPIIFTEGFGNCCINFRSMEIFRKNEGKSALISAATQVRAGVKRPEIIVTQNTDLTALLIDEADKVFQPGKKVRIIRDGCFGCCGVIENLPRSGNKMFEVRIENTNDRISIAAENIELLS
ncbi:MAG: hypothetical protein HQM10_15805 [Candidatus Riflebacteria bacterium]|nr:hypothetical protein [Candidatus Riflebacteria bacterium]